MNIKKIAITLAAAVSNGVALSQTPGGAGNLTLNGSLVSGGVATFDVARRVAITSASNISNRTLTFTGTDRYGNTQTEILTGPNATTVYTTKDFKTVTQIAISGAAAGALTVGTNGVASTAWYPGDYKLGKINVITVELSTGAVLTYTVEFTPTNLNDTTQNLTAAQQIAQAQNATVFISTDTNVVAASTNQATNSLIGMPGSRLTLNSWTSGTASITFMPPNNHVE